MFGLVISSDWAPWVALAIMVIMFVLFVRETFAVEVTAIAGAAAMILLGLLPVKEAVGVLSNPAR
jgi:Na+/H+ antiporter NhaD/arsenite permease-like protein